MPALWGGLLAGGGALFGGLLGSSAAANEAATQASIANANLANSYNQQRYQQALNAIALQRSIAGMTDGMGNQSVYDPTTNEWRTTLSPEQSGVAHASDAAGVARNTTDQSAQRDANDESTRSSLAAARDAESALIKLRYTPTLDPRALEGRLQEGSTIANRDAMKPVIQDTLRAFARQGTAAGPVLSDMMRGNATSLRAGMLDNEISALENTPKINAANRGAALSEYGGLKQAATPILNYVPVASTDPSMNIAQIISQRANNAPQSASYAAAATPSATNAANNAAAQAIANPATNPLGAQIIALSSAIKNFTSQSDPNSPSIIEQLLGNSGTNGDYQTNPYAGASSWGIDPESFGNTDTSAWYE